MTAITAQDIAALRRQGFYIEMPAPERHSPEPVRQSYNQCRRNGLCVRCGQPAKLIGGKPGVLCHAHAELNRQRSMERRRKMKEAMARRFKQ